MKGQSARQECPVLILALLLEKKELSFEEIVLSIPHSRGTINKYLNELYDDKLVDRRGRRGKYYLTPKGKEYVVRQYGESNEKAFNDYMKSIILLAQEGHAKILTLDELNKIDFPNVTGIPVELVRKGLVG